MEVARDFPEYTFAIADEEDYSTELIDLGLGDSGEDVNVAILDVSGKKYAMEPDEFDSDTLREFVITFKKGTVFKCDYEGNCCSQFCFWHLLSCTILYFLKTCTFKTVTRVRRLSR